MEDNFKKQLDQQMQLENRALKIRCLELVSNIRVETQSEGKYPIVRSLNTQEMIESAQKLYDFITI